MEVSSDEDIDDNQKNAREQSSETKQKPCNENTSSNLARHTANEIKASNVNQDNTAETLEDLKKYMPWLSSVYREPPSNTKIQAFFDRTHGPPYFCLEDFSYLNPCTCLSKTVLDAFLKVVS